MEDVEAETDTLGGGIRRHWQSSRIAMANPELTDESIRIFRRPEAIRETVPPKR